MLEHSEEGAVPTHKPEGEFTFDAEVAGIFDNMAARSIPMYAEAHRLHASLLAARFSRYEGLKRLLDIGASTGEFIDAVHKAVDPTISCKDAHLHCTAVDISQPMIDRINTRMPWVRTITGDASSDSVELPANTFDAISIFYVLQFMPPESRMRLLHKAYKALRPDGILILGQKDTPQVLASDKANEYHKFRLSNGYSVDEVFHKTVALANSMTPVTHEQLIGMLTSCGFRIGRIEETTRWLQFSTLVAVKDSI